MKKLSRLLIFIFLLSGCSSTQIPHAVINSVLFGGDVSFAHAPDKLVLEEVNQKLRKKINQAQENIHNPR